MTTTYRTILTILISILVGACSGSGVGQSAAPTATLASPSAPPSPTPMPTTTPRPTPTPTPTPAATPAEGTALFAWLPPVDPALPATFHLDDFVVPAAAVPVSGSPGGEPYRHDNGDPDPVTHPLMGYGGLTLIVLHGPVVLDGVEWYYLAPAQLAIDIPSGWSPLTSPQGEQWLAPAALPCPPSPVEAADLAPLALTDGLPGCYASSELTISGDLTCSTEPDPWVVGPEWLDGGTCHLADVHFTIYGLDPGLTPGRYAVTGHFDDPASGTCRDRIGDGTGLHDLNVVLHCRRGLVASRAVAVH